MLEKITYKNHLNETVDFGDGGLYLNINDLHSYKWKYNAKNSKISRFYRDVVEKKIPIVVVPPNNRSEGNSIMNNLMEIAEKDVIANESGRIICGDYYLKCFLFANEKKNYDLQNGIFYATITAVVENSTWTKEYTFNYSPESGQGGTNLDYPFDFPYDFASPSRNSDLVNYGFADSDFEMRIFGQVTDPAIVIGGHTYEVTGTVDSGQYLAINSRDKTVNLILNNGSAVNWFSHRNKESYIFQKIPSGLSKVLWDGTFEFDITLFEERSEPKWT